LHNLLHFLRLRLADDAQYEIRQYAQAIYHEFVKPFAPIICEAWEATFGAPSVI
jgi:thymidylate synthase (FAD)